MDHNKSLPCNLPKTCCVFECPAANERNIYSSSLYRIGNKTSSHRRKKHMLNINLLMVIVFVQRINRIHEITDAAKCFIWLQSKGKMSIKPHRNRHCRHPVSLRLRFLNPRRSRCPTSHLRHGVSFKAILFDFRSLYPSDRKSFTSSITFAWVEPFCNCRMYWMS